MRHALDTRGTSVGLPDRAERVAGVDGLRDWERVAVDGSPYRELQPYRPGARCWTSGYWPTGGCGCGEEPGRPAVGVFSDTSRPSAEAIGFCRSPLHPLAPARPGPSGVAATTS